jgi:hypothetical protein
MGHGWVTPNPDGTKARCGGPAICPACALEAGQQLAAQGTAPASRPDAGQITAVLLADGRWHDVAPGSYRTWSRTTAGEGTEGRFLFREGGELIKGPLSSVLATREAT